MMRILGNLGTLRVGATAGVEIYWKRQWYINYSAASATLTKTVTLEKEDLSAFYIKGQCNAGNVNLEISQDNLKKVIDLSGVVNEKINLAEFHAGLVKLVLTLKPAKRFKYCIGCGRRCRRENK